MYALNDSRHFGAVPYGILSRQSVLQDLASRWFWITRTAGIVAIQSNKENKDALSNAIEELKDARDDVKRRVDEAENNPNELIKRTHKVDSWLQRTQTIEGEVDEILEKTDQEIQGRCFGGYCPKNCWSACKIGKLVTRKLDIVKDLRNKGTFDDVAYKLSPSFVQKEPVELTVGMESMLEKVWRWLADDEIRIMGLYGCGGVGKTTLLQQINNEFIKSTTTTTHGFDVVILVVVSKAVNIDAIQKEIGDRLGLSSPNKTNIWNFLIRRNFLLLLDDIWERVDLQSIGIPRPENNMSKVIFTTRSKTVCGHMDANKKFRVECLPWDEAWTLFQEKVGNEALNSHPKLPALAKVVAKECGGLPLALITIGRAMSTKKTAQEWNHAITTLRKSASEFPGMGDEILPLLKLSYDSLRNDTIKSCFLYCALYPEDHSIKKAKLIDYWIGEGLILLNEFDHIDEARNHGYDVIGILKGACLLENGEDEETEVKMHDTIRDLALWIARECGSSKRDKMFIIEMSDLTPERWYNAERISERWYNAERIYLRGSSTGNAEIEVTTPPPKSPNLVTLINDNRSWPSSLNLSELPQNFFELMPLLRVLDLSFSGMKTFPTSIIELLELRYLSLSGTEIKELPEELGKMVKLNYLDLSDMMHLKKIPRGVIGSLLELRVLNQYTWYLGADWDLEEVYNLKHLNDLAITIKTQHNLNKLLSNQNVRMCTRRLHLLSSSSSSTTTTTTLGVDGSSIKSLEKLELLSNLETLYLDTLPEAAELMMNMNMAQQQQHHHLRSCFFQNLIQIEIRKCNALKDLIWVGYVGSLMTLCVSKCEELEEIVLVVDDDFRGGSTGGGDDISRMIMNNVEDVFKSLRTLKMLNLPKLKSICRNALAFPCLESMHIDNCPQLKKLPFDSGSNFNNTLQSIVGGRKWWSELQWEEEEEEEEDHDNNNNEVVKSKFLPHFVEIGKKLMTS